MAETKSSVSDLFSEAPLSEPLKTYKDNIEALDAVAIMSLETALTKEEKWAKVGGEIIQVARDLRRSREESKSKIDQLEGDKTITAQAKESLEPLRECIHKIEDLLKDCQSMAQSYLQIYNSYRRQRKIIMPMLFVYLVTIWWDAFIIDTMRKIIRLHPNSISDYEKMMRLIRLTKWNVNGEALWDYLIECKVRKLSSKQKAVLRCFKQDWEIDLKVSGVPLDKVIEIRARRNIWVHNKGVINQQYIDMVGGDTSHKRGRVAKITYKYLVESEATLTKLAVYIHKIAHEKYYMERIL